MRLFSVMLVAFFAGCLGAADSNEDSITPSSQVSEQDRSADPEPEDARKASPGPGRDDSNDSEQTGVEPNETTPEPPAPMHWEGYMGLIAVSQAGPWPECNGLNGCNGPFFQIGATFDIEATLSWDLPTNDLDLYLCRWIDKQCDEVSRDGINNKTDTPTTRQVLRHADLPAGYYRLWIVPQHGVEMNYELDAVFR